MNEFEPILREFVRLSTDPRKFHISLFLNGKLQWVVMYEIAIRFIDNHNLRDELRSGVTFV